MEISPAPPDPKQLVRAGYDAVSYAYCADDATGGDRPLWIDVMAAGLAAGASVLDVGCGCGVPVCRQLAAAGFSVTGVDVSEVQIERARRLTPGAEFIRADATELALPPASIDAVVCLYLLIHVPLDEQPTLLARFASWLRPGGALLITTGHDAWTGLDPDWNGWGAPMWWSHADASTYRGWLDAAGFTVDDETFVPEGSGGHALFRAHRR